MNSNAKVIAGTAIVVVGMIVAGLAAVFMPDGRFEHLGRWLTDPATALALAGLVTAVGGAIYRARHQAVPLLLCLLLAPAVVGCGASALAGQARAASVVGVGLGSMRQELHDARAHDLEGCATAADTDACLDTREAAWAPIVAIYESARATLSTWIEAIDVARVAGGDDHDVIAALVVAAVRLARQWRELAAALEAAGVHVPTIPASLAALLPPDGGST